MNRSVIAVSVVLTLVVGACTGDDDDATETSAVGSVASTALPTTEFAARGVTGTVTVDGQPVTVTTTVTVDHQILPGSRTVTETATADPSQGVTARAPDAPRRKP